MVSIVIDFEEGVSCGIYDVQSKIIFEGIRHHKLWDSSNNLPLIRNSIVGETNNVVNSRDR